MGELTGKRLLLLGGSLWKDAIKQFADDNEIVLLATGNNKSAGIFDISSEVYNVNSTESEAMKQLIIEKKIDGVYIGGSEPVIAAASRYLNELGMPCYCKSEQWNCLENKANLKELFQKFGLPVAKRFEITPDNIEYEVPQNEYPVITKPVDGSGSTGFSVCNNVEELKRGFCNALSSSSSGSVLVEKFVPNDSIVAIYRMCGGKLIFGCLEDKYPVRYDKQGSYVAGMHIFESKRTIQFRKLYEKKIEKMLFSIGITDGPIWFEIFLSGDDFCFNEVGYRYSGSVTVWPFQYFAGVNEVATDIYYALTGESRIDGFNSLIDDSFEHKKYYAIYSIHLKPGRIKTVLGIDDLLQLKNVVSIPVAKDIGAKVEDTGTVGQVFAFVHFVFDNKIELVEMINTIHERLIIEDENGKNMVNRMVELSRVDGRLL